jgi:hypothetical protein
MGFNTPLKTPENRIRLKATHDLPHRPLRRHDK